MALPGSGPFKEVSTGAGGVVATGPPCASAAAIGAVETPADITVFDSNDFELRAVRYSKDHGCPLS